MATIVHFDIPANDMERAAKFYEALFDWTFQKIPGETPYYLIETTDLKGNKGVAGGLGQRGVPGQQITNFVGVDSIDDYLQKVESLGGKVMQPKMPVAGFGYLAVCMDTEENSFGIWQDDEKAAT